MAKNKVGDRVSLVEEPVTSTKPEQTEPAEMTWTLAEIEQWFADYIDSVGLNGGYYPAAKAALFEMKHSQDPEYQKYLELKAKFEGE